MCQILPCVPIGTVGHFRPTDHYFSHRRYDNESYEIQLPRLSYQGSEGRTKAFGWLPRLPHRRRAARGNQGQACEHRLLAPRNHRGCHQREAARPGVWLGFPCVDGEGGGQASPCPLASLGRHAWSLCGWHRPRLACRRAPCSWLPSRCFARPVLQGPQSERRCEVMRRYAVIKDVQRPQEEKGEATWPESWAAAKRLARGWRRGILATGGFIAIAGRMISL